MDLKTRSERIEGTMLSREYFDQSSVRNDKSDLIVSKLDEALRVLTEFQPRKPSIEPSMPTIEPSKPSLEPRMPSSTEEADDHLENPVLSLRLRQVLEVFATRRRATPKQLGQLLGIATNTACEHLRRLERLGVVRRVSRGLYEDLRGTAFTRAQITMPAPAYPHTTKINKVQITTPASMKILFSCASRFDVGLADSCGL